LALGHTSYETVTPSVDHWVNVLYLINQFKERHGTLHTIRKEDDMKQPISINIVPIIIKKTGHYHFRLKTGTFGKKQDKK
jgi:hypothetical protein